MAPELEYQARNYSQAFIGEWRNSHSDLSLGKRRREEKWLSDRKTTGAHPP
jgi:hypothetical protein